MVLLATVQFTQDEIKWVKSALLDKLVETRQYIGISQPRRQAHHDPCCAGEAARVARLEEEHALLKQRHDLLMSALAKVEAGC